ncbi:MAG: 16S rRNA (adenine(1518)-N(6)/adenine(1519)-N(6))-dimethyltransferase RsmA [Myxococcota bacterium]
MNLGELRGLLDQHGLRLSRDLGQNFLVDAETADDLARRAGASEGDFVIEVGTGLGVLTRALASRAARVRSVEIDSGLVRVLEAERLLPENVELVHADARDVPWREWLTEARAGGDGPPVRLIANLPYSVATPLLRTMLDLRDVLEDWSVMIQTEVAARLAADTGTRDYGSLSVLHRLTTDVDTIAKLSPGRFFPKPKVDSSFVRIWPRASSPVAKGELEKVERVARAAFSTRRKQVTNGLSRIAERKWPELEKPERRAALEETLRGVGLDPGLRPERIEPEAWLELARALDIEADVKADAGASQVERPSAESKGGEGV